MQGQKKTEKDALKKKEKIEAEQEKLAEENHDALLKLQFEKQGKLTQKRMLKNKKMLDKYYRHQKRQTIWQKIFPKQKPKKYRNLS